MKDKIYTQHVPFRQNTEGKVRGKGLKVVWGDVDEVEVKILFYYNR